MSLLEWWKSRKRDEKALIRARADRQSYSNSLTDDSVTLHNNATQLKLLMAAILEKRGGRDA